MTQSSTLSVVLEQVFLKDKNGRYGSLSTFDDKFWARYLSVFDQVRIVARVKSVPAFSEQVSILTDERIVFFEVPHYRGFAQYARRYMSVNAALKRATQCEGPWVVRLPGTLGMTVTSMLRKKRRIYAVELVGDPFDVFQPGGAGSGIVRPLARMIFTRETKTACRAANAVAYVTQSALQRRYPSNVTAVTETYSSITLRRDQFVSVARHYTVAPSPLRLIFVGSLAQTIKGVDILIRAVKHLVDKGNYVSLAVIGSGALKKTLEAQARSEGVHSSVTFLGHMDREKVFEALDGADIFVLPSRGEGLPRVIIEAMARGLPCISTAVSGIPELLDAQFLAPPNDHVALADLIEEAANCPKLLTRMSTSNLEKAQNYEASVLSRSRYRFYSEIRRMSDAV